MPAKKAAKGAKAAPRKAASDTLRMPPRIFAEASPRSIGGVSLFEAGDQVNFQTIGHFASEQSVIMRSAQALQDAGFEILQMTATTINIAGSAATYEKAFGSKLGIVQREVIKPGAVVAMGEFIEPAESPLPGLLSTEGTAFADLIEGVAIEEPRYFMAPSMFPPLKSYWHLHVPEGVSLACNADKAHRSGITGKGVTVAMVDSGHFKHPFFVGRGYRVSPVVLGPGAANPTKDESGHGTGESANIFAVAPDVQLMPVKINFTNSIGAFNAAVALKPDIITCSWGSSKKFGPLSAADQALAAAISVAVANGIIVVFSAGNGHWGFPGQHPDVISAGGVFMDVDESLKASNYASGFASNIYAGRNVPDLSGLVGMQPKAAYIMLPLEPKDDIDVGNAGGTHPNGDETKNDDGWAAFSGTSAAAPQLAGAAALVKQACAKLTPAEVRDILMKSARDVTKGSTHPNTGPNTAKVGPDLATGNGLVDAHKATLMAKIRCLGITPITIQPPITVGPPIQPPITVGPPIQPPITVGPPIQPIGPPITPVQPVIPITPVQPGPITPIQPVQPGPITPVQPPRPISPVINPGPVTPGGRVGQSGESAGLSGEDVEAIEEMIMNSEFEGGV
jgi:subtilisin family serine protease